MFKKLVSTILIMALLLQCSTMMVFAGSEDIEMLDFKDVVSESETVVLEEDNIAEVVEDAEDSIVEDVEFEESVDLEESEQEDVIDTEIEETDEPVEIQPEESEAVEEPAETQPEEVEVQLAETEKAEDEKIEEAEKVDESKEKEEPAENEDEKTEVVVPDVDNTQEQFEETLGGIENDVNESLSLGRKDFFSLYEDEIPALEQLVVDNYQGVDAVNYTSLFGKYGRNIVFENGSLKTVRAIVNTFESNLNLSESEAIVGLYAFNNEGKAPLIRFEVVYTSETSAPLYFENAVGTLVELGEPKCNEQDGMFHAVVYLDTEALEKLNFYSNPDNAADVLKLVSDDAVIYAISVVADRYCFANAVTMFSDTTCGFPVFSSNINFPESKGYGYTVSYSEGELYFNCLSGSWIEIILDNDDITIRAEETFVFTLPEVPAGKVDATLPKDDEKKNGEKDKDEKDEENKLATDTDLDISTPAIDTDLVDNTESTVPSAPVEIEVVPDATPIAPETIEDLPLNVTETVEVVEETEEKAEVVVEAQEEESPELQEEEIEDSQSEETNAVEEAEESEEESKDEESEEDEDGTADSGNEEDIQQEEYTEPDPEETSETIDYSVIEDLVEEDTTPIEYDSTPVEFDSTEINYNE